MPFKYKPQKPGFMKNVFKLLKLAISDLSSDDLSRRKFCRLKNLAPKELNTLFENDSLYLVHFIIATSLFVIPLYFWGFANHLAGFQLNFFNVPNKRSSK